MAIETRLFDYDPETRTKRLFHYDHATDDVTIETLVDVEDVVEFNKLLMNADTGNWKGDMHKVASIPMCIYMQLKEQGILTDQARLKHWLNDRDNRVFRTKPGVV